MLYAGVFSLMTTVILGVIYWATVAQIDAQIDAGLRAEKNALVTLFRDQGPDSLEIAIAQRSSLRNQSKHDRTVPAEPGKRQYFLGDAHYHRLAGDIHAWPKGVRGSPAWATFRVDNTSAPPDADADAQPHRLRALAVTLANGDHLLVGQALNEADKLSASILYLTLVAVGLSFLMAAVGGTLMGRSVLKRVDAVNSAANDIINGDLSRRIVTGNREDEFGGLAARLNAMLTRIEQLIRNIREVSENIAHDLRSPVSRLRSRLEITLLEPREEVDYRDALTRTVEDTEALLVTFNAVLSIAQLDAGVQRGRWDEVDLGEIAADAAKLYAAAAEARRIEFSCNAEPHATVRGSRQILSQAVGNLLDNAIKYTPPNGRIALDVTSHGKAVRLRVADTGPGIPPDEYEHVLERFVRLDTSRGQSGNGLGLSLVRAVIDAHGGRLFFQDNAPGLRVVVELPEFEPFEEG
jgi:signal transduction histidine kinase